MAEEADDLKNMVEKAMRGETIAAPKPEEEQVKEGQEGGEENKPLILDFSDQEDDKGKENSSEKEVNNLDLSKFGEYQTAEDLYADFQKYKQQVEGIEQEKGSFLTKEKEYKEQLSKLEEQSKTLIEDESLLRLNIAKKSENPKFNLFANIALNGKDSIPDREAIRLKYLYEIPDLKDDLEALDAYIDDKYGISEAPSDLEEDDEDYIKWKRKNSINKIRLKKDANEFKDSLETEFNSIEIPKKSKLSEEDILIQKTDAKNAWNPYVKDATAVITNFEKKFKVGETEFDFKFDATPELKEKYSKKLQDFVFENRIPLTEENVTQIVSGIKANFIVENIDTIINSIVEEALLKYDDMIDKEINPRSSSNKQIKKPNTDDLKSIVMKAMENIH